MAALGGDVDIGLHAPLLEESSSDSLAAYTAGEATPTASSSGSSFNRSLSVGNRPRYSCRSRSSVDTPPTVAEGRESPSDMPQTIMMAADDPQTTPAPMHITSPGGSGPRSSGPHSAPSKFTMQVSKSNSLVHADV